MSRQQARARRVASISEQTPKHSLRPAMAKGSRPGGLAPEAPAKARIPAGAGPKAKLQKSPAKMPPLPKGPAIAGSGAIAERRRR